MAETNEAAGATKRTNEAPAGLRTAQAALQQPDEELASNPEYVKYAKATAAAGGTPMTAFEVAPQS